LERLSWRDAVFALLVGAILWLPFRLTGLLGGVMPATFVVLIGFVASLPMLKTFNRHFPRSALKRVLSKLAMLASFCLLAVLMKLVIEGGLANTQFGMARDNGYSGTPAMAASGKPKVMAGTRNSVVPRVGNCPFVC
jgi:hypothetical protein